MLKKGVSLGSKGCGQKIFPVGFKKAAGICPPMRPMDPPLGSYRLPLQKTLGLNPSMEPVNELSSRDGARRD